MKELIMIQQGLKAPKGQFNKFGNYKYRSCEDILEAVKPLLDEQACTLVISDDIVLIGDRFYIKATATLTNSEGVKEIATAFAREQESKAGMDSSQLTGSTSSYARKYALNGLFCIDDTKDADTMDNTSEGQTPATKPKQEDTRPWMTEKQLHSALDRIAGGMLGTLDQCKEAFRMKKDYKERLENAVSEYKINNEML
jgi:hypothetical protein